MHPAHLGKGLEQGQAEPLEEGKGLGAAGHLAGREAGHVGQQVGGQALEHLGLVEAEFAFGTEQTLGFTCRPTQHPSPALRSWSLVSVAKCIPEAPQRGPGPMDHIVSMAAFRAGACHGGTGTEFDTAAARAPPALRAGSP